MKNPIKKSLSTFLALVLILSALSVAAFAASHSHQYATSDGGYDYIPYDNTVHAYVHYTNYDCACGDHFQIYSTVSKLAHKAAAGSQICLGSYSGLDGSVITTYQYTCRVCGDTYTVSVTE